MDKRKNNNLINPMSPIGKYWMTHPWFLGGIGILKFYIVHMKICI